MRRFVGIATALCLSIASGCSAEEPSSDSAGPSPETTVQDPAKRVEGSGDAWRDVGQLEVAVHATATFDPDFRTCTGDEESLQLRIDHETSVMSVDAGWNGDGIDLLITKERDDALLRRDLAWSDESTTADWVRISLEPVEEVQEWRLPDLVGADMFTRGGDPFFDFVEALVDIAAEATVELDDDELSISGAATTRFTARRERADEVTLDGTPVDERFGVPTAQYWLDEAGLLLRVRWQFEAPNELHPDPEMQVRSTDVTIEIAAAADPLDIVLPEDGSIADVGSLSPPDALPDTCSYILEGWPGAEVPGSSDGGPVETDGLPPDAARDAEIDAIRAWIVTADVDGLLAPIMDCLDLLEVRSYFPGGPQAWSVDEEMGAAQLVKHQADSCGVDVPRYLDDEGVQFTR